MIPNLANQNSQRAARARIALAAYRIEAHLTDEDDLETGIGDLICDLMHLCDREFLNFDHLLQGARMHHFAEYEQ